MPIPLPSLSDISTAITLLVIPVAAWGAALWFGLIIWTFKDMRARSRDPFAQILAAFMVGVLTAPGWLIYLMLRPRETLAEAYERALEEEALLQEIEEKAACPGCSRPIQDDWKICPHCHTRLRKDCPDCGRLLELQWNLCPYCGNSAGGGIPMPTVDSEPPPDRQDVGPSPAVDRPEPSPGDDSVPTPDLSL